MTLGSASDPIGPIGQVWSTYTEVGDYTFGIIFATEIQNSYNITPMEAFHTEVLFHDRCHSWVDFSGSQSKTEIQFGRNATKSI